MNRKVMPGDWRAQPGKKPAHLYKKAGPICGARIEWVKSERVPQPMDTSRLCTDCLVNAIGERDYSKGSR